jgi:putative transposase
MEAGFCIEALEEALARHGRPDIFNTDQGSQGGFNWSSQHSDGRSCDDGSEAALGSRGARHIEVAGAAGGGAT